MTVTFAIAQIRKQDFSVLRELDLKQVYAVAEKLGADTSLAKRMRGRGFQFDALSESIRAVVDQSTEGQATPETR